MTNVIVYELNEVPIRLFEFYADAFKHSAFAELRKMGNCFETKAPDMGHLSPWVTWPTLHRGISNFDHKISDLGQDLTLINREAQAFGIFFQRQVYRCWPFTIQHQMI